MNDTASINALLDILAGLPLADRQASAFMAEIWIPVTIYLDYY